MKAKELKEIVNQLSDEDDIYFNMDSGCCGDYEQLEVHDLDLFKSFECFLIVRFRALPGYRSCLQVGGTKRQDEEYWKDKNKS